MTYLRLLPEIIALIREIWGALHDFKQEYDRSKTAKELKEAIRDARENKDTAKIEEFFNSNKPVPDGGQLREEVKEQA